MTDPHKNHNTESINGITVCHDCQKTLGRTCEVYTRCVGYLRPKSGFNKGKLAEVNMRKTYKVNI